MICVCQWCSDLCLSVGVVCVVECLFLVFGCFCCVLGVCVRGCDFCLICDACSWTCSFIGNMCVSSCRLFIIL